MLPHLTILFLPLIATSILIRLDQFPQLSDSYSNHFENSITKHYDFYDKWFTNRLELLLDGYLQDNQQRINPHNYSIWGANLKQPTLGNEVFSEEEKDDTEQFKDEDNFIIDTVKDPQNKKQSEPSEFKDEDNFLIDTVPSQKIKNEENMPKEKVSNQASTIESVEQKEKNLQSDDFKDEPLTLINLYPESSEKK